MSTTITKCLIATILTAHLVGGGSICIHEVASWFADDCHQCEHHHHDEGAPTSSETPCDCDIDGFTGSIPSALKIHGPGEFFPFDKGTHATQPDISVTSEHSRERWQHPPPLLVSDYSPPRLQRFNV